MIMGIHQPAGRILLASLLVMMPLVTLSAASRSPANQAGGLHLVSMAGLAFLSMASFRLRRTRLAAVFAVFAFSALMELLHNTLFPIATAPGPMWELTPPAASPACWFF